MAISTPHPKTAAGKIFLVSGLSHGHEVFLGKAIDEPYEDRLALEGKLFSFAPQGLLVARPFQTLTSFHLKDAQYCVQHITHPKAHEEAVQLLNLAIGHVGRAAFPLLYRWIETATQGAFPIYGNGALQAGIAGQPALFGPNAIERSASLGHVLPFHGLYQGFLSTIEQFRRAIFHARQVTSTRELDRVAELEGELAIEIGKVANQIAIKFHQLATKENELFQYLEAFQGSELALAHVRHSMAGWLYLFDQVQSAKAWARRTGKVALVREFNALIKEGIFGLNEVVLEHCNALDTLITETFSQYGISYEIYGELSPFTAYGAPTPSAYHRDPARTLVGAGA